jgi:hypothetical protein
VSLVRTACVQDTEQIATLIAQLGYSVGVAALHERLESRSDRREVFVAESTDGVVGWVGVSVDETFVEGFGATEIRVRSNVVRKRAHEFNGRHGYAKVKAHYNFCKRL